MTPRTPARRPHPPTTAVVQVADDGTATLYLGTELVEHAVSVDLATVMRVLVDYTATLDTGVRVTTQMPDGTWTRHWLDPDGTIRQIPRNSPPVQSLELRTAGTTQQRSWSATRPGIRGRVVSRALIIAVLRFLFTGLLAAAISGTSR